MTVDPAPRPSPGRPRFPGPISLGVVVVVAWTAGAAGCGGAPDLSLRPDSVLQAELGLTERDRVHSVTLLGGTSESAEPSSLEVLSGDWVQFRSGDWRIHEVRFLLDSVPGEARSFLEETDQVASPPLVQKDARFVVSFRDAPEGRYPFMVEGHGSSVHGVVVVGSKR